MKSGAARACLRTFLIDLMFILLIPLSFSCRT